METRSIATSFIITWARGGRGRQRSEGEKRRMTHMRGASLDCGGEVLSSVNRACDSRLCDILSVDGYHYNDDEWDADPERGYRDDIRCLQMR